jgi:hypothetical protein
MFAIPSPVRLESMDPNCSQSNSPERDTDRVTPLTRGASVRLAHLSDTELLMRTQDLVGRSNQVLAALLEHLAEVEARGLYRERASRATVERRQARSAFPGPSR